VVVSPHPGTKDCSTATSKYILLPNIGRGNSQLELPGNVLPLYPRATRAFPSTGLRVKIPARAQTRINASTLAVTASLGNGLESSLPVFAEFLQRYPVSRHAGACERTKAKKTGNFGKSGSGIDPV